MIIKALTNSYIQNILIQNNSEQYINSFPELFKHYFDYWCSYKQFDYNITSKEIEIRSKKIITYLELIDWEFLIKNIEIEDFEIVLFIGNNTSNGHAFKHHDKFVVWLPIETLTSDKLIDVFVPHEIAHAVHYTMNPQYYFNNMADKTNTFRQLFTEGIATLVSKIISNSNEKIALWADYLQKEDLEMWYNNCEKYIPDLIQFALNNIDKSIPNNTLFTVNNNKLGNRRGYYLGLKITQIIYDRFDNNLNKLLSLNRQEAETFTKQILQNL